MVRVSLMILSAAKRTPMIRFRKAAATAANTQASYVEEPAVRVSSSESTIEDYNLPSRYARKGIDKFEMEYINRGGPE